MLRIAAVGHINVDIYLKVDSIPESDSRVTVQEMYISPGGAALNYAVTVAKFRQKAYLVATCGEDLLSQEVLHFLREANVDTTFVRIVEGFRSGMAVILVDKSGMKYMLVHPGANIKLKDLTFDEKLLQDVDHVHVVVAEVETFEKILQELKDRKFNKLSIGLRPEIAVRGVKYLQEVCPSDTRFLFLNLPEARMLTGCRDIERILERLKDCIVQTTTFREVVLTLGEKGSVIVTGDRTVHIGAYSLCQVVDTTGAGDVYAAAFTVCRLFGLSIEEAGTVASVTASLKVCRRGSSNVPDVLEVLRALQMLNLQHVSIRLEEAIRLS